MGSLCTKRKSSDGSISVKSEKSKKGSSEHVDNHAQSSKSEPESKSGAEATPSTIAAETPEMSFQAKESIRSRILREPEPSSVSGDSMSLSSPTLVNAPLPEIPFPSKLPLEIKKQSDLVKNLMVGRISKVKPMSSLKKITLYVCTADSQDYRLEKGSLHTEVYSALRQYCSTEGFELHITDLHWKTDLETKQDHDFPELCLGELRRQQEVAHVIPVLFLSNSLGPPLLPKTMEQQDFELALSNISNKNGKGLLEKWYKLDAHAQPQCYRLSPVSEHLPNIKSETPSERTTAMAEWVKIVDDMLDTMLRVFPTELRDTYLTTVIEQEIHNSIFMSRDVGKRSIWTNRSFTGKQPQSPDMLTPAEVEKNRRLESLHTELKNQLVADRILTFSVKWTEGGICTKDSEHVKYLSQVSDQLTSHLRAAVKEIMQEEKIKGNWKSCYGLSGTLCSEVMHHTIFCQQGAKCCLSFDNVVTDIKNYVGSDSRSPLVLHGPPASGKTTFMSRVIHQASSWYPDFCVVHRFVGLTPESRSLVQLLRSVTTQVSLLVRGRTYWIPHNAKCYLKELYKMVTTATMVVIIIDGLDKLTTNDTSALDVLSESLPPKLKLIVSCTDNTLVFQSIQTRISQSKGFIQMPSLSLLSAESLLTASILQYSHSIDSEVQKRLSAKLNSCLLPIYIKILAWTGAIDRDGVIILNQASSVESLITPYFDFLEKTLEAEKVRLALGLLSASRNGLCDSELLDFLAHSTTFGSKVTFIDWAPASVFLAQLFRLLGPFLEWRVVSGEEFVVQWKDSLLFDLAKNRYAGNSVSHQLRQTLLGYFKGDWKDRKNGRFIEWTSSRNFRRALDELPFLECHLKRSSIKQTYLCNLEWIVKKIQTVSVFSVLEDMDLDPSTASDDDLTLFRYTLELSASALTYDSSQFYEQMYNRLLPYRFGDSGGGDADKNFPFTKTVFEAAKSNSTGFGILSNFLQSPKNYRELVNSNTSFKALSDGDIYFDEIYRMKGSSQFVVTVATTKEEVTVWDVYSEVPVRTMKGVHNPVSLKVIDAHRCVILCGRELITYNLDSGTFITKLKGVMNQKMPFYGLHDDNHIVAISRNRMYVNLMNIDSGDCITTFKVGEDRFLNSLLVSENGKLLVCGDETQKPFPLLVWDLPSRKLLYDLRIPHHEFVTSLASITKEGHFVCCVCREVDEYTGPNFIVVYDLQSGTLFKKWKPGCNTQAIAISAQGGCVINGLEDNRIIVWDLVTGASQWSLEKHIAPPDILKLDNRGARCVSCDSEGRDRSICLWDVTKGLLLAIYTPDTPFTACEVFNNGNGIVLGLKGRPEVVTLTFDLSEGARVDEKYGSDEHHGKVTVFGSS